LVEFLKAIERTLAVAAHGEIRDTSKGCCPLLKEPKRGARRSGISAAFEIPYSPAAEHHSDVYDFADEKREALTL
jgi:hypothetical protein